MTMTQCSTMVKLDVRLAIEYVWLNVLFLIKSATDNEQPITPKDIFLKVVNKIKSFIQIKTKSNVSIQLQRLIGNIPIKPE